MLYTSFNFLVFAAALALVFYLVPKRIRWVVLLVASGVFYYSLSGYLIAHIVAMSALAWLISRRMAGLFLAESQAVVDAGNITSDEKKAIRRDFQGKRKVLLTIGCLALFGSLLVFKFYNPASRLFAGAGLQFGVIAVPVGIAFYTLQIGSYLFDVYNRGIEAEPNPLRFLLFSCYFPGILQGPISRYAGLSGALRCETKFDYERFANGFVRILWGFFKKMVIADRLYWMTQTVFDNSDAYEGVVIALIAIIYKVQLYADFSGGIDISIGISKMLGIDLAENFNLPYFAKNVSEYWRRWHITLGNWFRDYVFYPLSLSAPMNRLSKWLRKRSNVAAKYLPSILCMLALWLCSAVWHGEGTQFLLWGLFHWSMVTLDVFFERGIGGFIAKRKLVFRKIAAGTQILGTFLIVSFGELIFKSNGIAAALRTVGSLFRPWNWSALRLESLETLGLGRADLIVAAAAIALLFLVELLMYLEIVPHPAQAVVNAVLPLRWLILLALAGIVLIFGMYGYGFDPVPFVYFQF